MSGFQFAQPGMLALLLVIPVLMLWRRWRGRAPVAIVPYAAAWAGARRPSAGRIRLAALYAAVALLILAVARPQRTDAHEVVVSRSYDLILAIDLSTSMLAEDYRTPQGIINRLEALRPILRAFVTRRPNDRIGVVVFAGRAYTLAPLTTDHEWLDGQIAALKIGLIEDGTAIGDGLGVALTALEAGRGQDEAAVGKFVILLTDGANTSGGLTPPQSIALARYRRVPVYTIGVGRDGMVPFPIFDAAGRRIGVRQFPSSLDVEALRTMSAATGGRHLQAEDAGALQAAFKSIDAARKAEVRVKTRLVATELFAWFAAPGLGAMLLAAPGWRAPQRRRRAQTT